MASAPAPAAPPRGTAAPDARPAVPTAGVPVWRWAAYDVAVWSAVSLVFAAQAVTRADVPFARALADSAVSFVPCALFTPLVGYVAARWRFTEGARWRAALAHLAALAAFLTVGQAMMGVLEWALPWRPYAGGAWVAMREAIVRYTAIDVLIYGLIAAGVLALVYGRESRERDVRAARLQTQLAEAQLAALGAQLHPHFLFNALHVISALVRPDPKRAEQLIARLSELLREMLDNSDRVEVTLGQELAFLEKYVDIQEARFGPRLRVSFAVSPDARDAIVPRLILQPLVENAVRHGIARRAEPGSVAVSAECRDERLTLVVRDDGVGVPAGGPPRDGIGLSSTRARLRQLYGAEGHFSIERGERGGTVCVVRIPCRRGAAAEGAA